MKIRIVLLLAITCAASSGATIGTFQPADIVLGQTDFISKLVPATPTPSSMNMPTGVAVDPTTGKVFVADEANNRVLRYASADAMVSGSPAEAFFGQASSSTKSASDTPKEMDTPLAVAVDATGTLWVADSGNHRVLRFDHASAKPSVAITADGVLGQANLSSKLNPSPPTQASMNAPHGITVDANGTLWVADSANNRVLRFDNAATAINGANADGVLGAPTFTIDFGGVTTQYAMNTPDGVATDASGHLWVADFNNNRVLRFDHAASLSNGALASGVLGQIDFTSKVTPTPPTPASLSRPNGMAVDANGALWVGDFLNSRALRFDHADTKANNAAADAVVGQADFVTKGVLLTQSGLGSPFGLTIDSSTGALWIADTVNARVLHYTPETTAQKAAPVNLVVSGKRKSATAAAAVTIKGAAACADGIAKIEYRVGKKGGFKTAGGTTGWRFKARLKPGKNTITIHAFGVTGAEATTTVLVIRG